jgi:hypothetical protein
LQAHLSGRGKSGSFLVVADYHGDFRRYFPCLNVAGDSLKVRTASGEQDAKIFHESHPLVIDDW